MAFDELPNEIVFYLLSFVDAETLLAFSQVNKRYSLVGCHDALWKNKISNEYLTTDHLKLSFLSNPFARNSQLVKTNPLINSYLASNSSISKSISERLRHPKITMYLNRKLLSFEDTLKYVNNMKHFFILTLKDYDNIHILILKGKLSIENVVKHNIDELPALAQKLNKKRELFDDEISAEASPSKKPSLR